MFDAREAQGVQMWLPTVPSTHFMSPYLAQVDMSCELRTFMATDMTVALWWETEVTAIDWVIGRTAADTQIAHVSVCRQ